jgi:hypothetical protein
MMNKSLRGPDRESSDKRGYGFRGSFPGIQPERDAKMGRLFVLTRILDANRYPLRSKTLWDTKKEPPETGGFES